jgi:hypothetical protein
MLVRRINYTTKQILHTGSNPVLATKRVLWHKKRKEKIWKLF